MMHKTLAILALFSVCFTHVVAAESGALKLYPLSESGVRGNCTFQLKGTKNPKIAHFTQIGVCVGYDAKGLPIDLKDCTAVSHININNNEMVLRNISQGGGFESALYKNDDYVVEMKFKDRDCEKVSCEPFIYDGVLTVKKGSLQRVFDVQGSCDFGEDG